MATTARKLTSARPTAQPARKTNSAFEPKANHAPGRSEAELIKSYPAIVPGSLRFEHAGYWAGKYTIQIHTIGPNAKPDGQLRRLATSDLHQTPWSESAKAELDGILDGLKRQIVKARCLQAAQRRATWNKSN